MFKRFKRDIRAQKFFSTAEEAMFFEQVAREVAAGEVHPGLQAMALSKCEGDEVKANAMYLQLRVDMLQQETALGEKLVEEVQREEREREERDREEAQKQGERVELGATEFKDNSESDKWVFFWSWLFIVALVALAMGATYTISEVP